MKSSRLLGHVLLWIGFLIAALAMVANKELDLLPTAEQEILNQLQPKLKIPKQAFVNLQTADFAELNEYDLQQAVDRINQWFATFQAEMEEAKKKQEPIPRLVHPLDRNAIIAIRTGRLTNLWSTIDWKVYVAGAMVGLLGVVILRLSINSIDTETDRSFDRFTTLEQALDKLQHGLTDMNHKFDDLIPEEIVEMIDDQLVLHFNDFADARNSITQRYGLSVFADVMSEFATAERYTNRAWSAAADGYMDEANACLAKSLRHLRETAMLLERAKGNQPQSTQNA